MTPRSTTRHDSLGDRHTTHTSTGHSWRGLGARHTTLTSTCHSWRSLGDRHNKHDRHTGHFWRVPCAKNPWHSWRVLGAKNPNIPKAKR